MQTLACTAWKHQLKILYLIYTTQLPHTLTLIECVPSDQRIRQHGLLSNYVVKLLVDLVVMCSGFWFVCVYAFVGVTSC